MFNIVDTGQEKCYDNRGRVIECPDKDEYLFGQDAQYSGIKMSFTDNDDGTITDNNTGLMWQKTPDFENLLTWEETPDYAENLRLGGYDDWRVPTMKELYSLTAFYGSIRSMTPYIDTSYFDFEYPDTTKGYRIIDAQYWTSNKYVGRTMANDESAFGFNFADGRIKSYPLRVEKYIRCVRGNPNYGKNDFVDNNDGTITDLSTGLMWTKDDSKTTLDWGEALEFAENSKQSGYDDWRLPNIKELHSIVDYSFAPDAEDAGMRRAAIDPVFNLTEMESWFWSSTTHGDNPAFATYIAFGRACQNGNFRVKR